MARGVRKSPMEKLQEQINEVQESVKQYESCLVTLKDREKELQEQIDLEEFKSIRDLLAEQGIEMEGLKEMLESNVTTAERQSV